MTEQRQEAAAAWNLHVAGPDSELYLPYTFDELFSRLQKELIRASNQRLLTNPIHEILARLKRTAKS